MRGGRFSYEEKSPAVDERGRGFASVLHLTWKGTYTVWALCVPCILRWNTQYKFIGFHTPILHPTAKALSYPLQIHPMVPFSSPQISSSPQSKEQRYKILQGTFLMLSVHLQTSARNPAS